MINAIFKAPFAEQIDYFRGKLNLPTERWDDILGAAHDRAFIVAGAMQADLLSDLRGAVDKAIAEGTGLGAFRKDFGRIVQQHGWDYTGGFDWRSQVIYSTNMRASYAAGRWAQLNDPALLESRPYWRYVHSDSVAHPRPLHLSWHGLVLRHDDPWWQTHFPPNGWGCQCRVVAATEGQYNAAPKSRAPDDGTWRQIDSRGVEHEIPNGIDYGWAHAPGARVSASLREIINDKLIRLDAPVGAAMYEHLKPALAMEVRLDWYDTLDQWRAGGLTERRSHVLGALSPDLLRTLDAEGLPAPLSAEIAVEDRLVLGPKERRHQAAQDGLTLAEWRRLPEVIDAPRATYLDTRTGKLVFLVGAGKDAAQKAVIGFDYRTHKSQRRLNMIVSAYRESAGLVAEMEKQGWWKKL